MNRIDFKENNIEGLETLVSDITKMEKPDNQFTEQYIEALNLEKANAIVNSERAYIKWDGKIVNHQIYLVHEKNETFLAYDSRAQELQ